MPASGTTQAKAPACPQSRGGARAKGAMTAILMAVAGVRTGVAMPTASAAGCPDIEIVFARGTDEPPGIGVVGQALVDSLRPLVKGKKIGTYAVKYPASWNFLAAAKGANDASARVQATAANCPDTKIVLGGYSDVPGPRTRLQPSAAPCARQECRRRRGVRQSLGATRPAVDDDEPALWSQDR